MYEFDIRDFLSEEEIRELTSDRVMSEDDAKFWEDLRKDAYGF